MATYMVVFELATLTLQALAKNSTKCYNLDHSYIVERGSKGRNRNMFFWQEVGKSEHKRNKRSLDCAERQESCGPTIFPRRNCRCDGDCVLYDDCCHDATVDVSLSHNRTQKLSCILLDLDSYWMVSGCPNTYKDQQVIDKCKAYSINDGNPYQIIPVFDPIEGVYYQNKYCAECNNINTDSYVPLNILVGGFMKFCTLPETSTENEFLLNLMRNPNCSVDFGSKGSPEGRRCIPDLITECSNTYLKNLTPHERTIAKDICEEGHFAPIFTMLTGISYRNFGCLNCSDFEYKHDKYSFRCGYNHPLKDLIPLRAILNAVFARQESKGQHGRRCLSVETLDPVFVSIRFDFFSGKI